MYVYVCVHVQKNKYVSHSGVGQFLYRDVGVLEF